MSVKICTSEFLLSTVDGMGLRRSYFPRPVRERFLESTKDGKITRAPDPVTMIDGSVSWFNNSDAHQAVDVLLQRAPRSIVAQSPSTVVIHDAYSSATGVRATADYPSVAENSFGGAAQTNRESTAAKNLTYGRIFIDADGSQEWVPCGVLAPGESIHFRYVCSVQTPGVWTAPSEFEARWEASALWARLQIWASPVMSA